MQCLYTTAFRGQLLGYTLERFAENPSGTFFGVHFSPFLFLLVPFYRIAPSAENLLVLQSFVVALGSFGVYVLSYHVHASRFTSLSLAIAYLLYTPIQALVWFDFHVQAFVPLLFLMMFYFYVREKYVYSFVFFVLTLSTIEMVPVLLFPFGLYCVLENRKKRKALVYSVVVTLICIGWFVLASFVKSSLNPMYSATFGAWDVWGTSYAEIITNIVTQPVKVALYFFTVFPLEKALYFVWFMAPLFFLPIFARKEFVFLVMPWIVLVFLSGYLGYYTNQYAAFIVPQVFVAAIYGLKHVSKTAGAEVFRKALAMRYAKWVLGASIITFILVNPFGLVPQARKIYIHGIPFDTPHKEALRNALQAIPENASVYTSFHIAPHLANRLELYAHAVPDKPVDYIVIDLKSPDTSISLGTFGGTPIAGLDELLQRYNYSLILSNDGILIYKLETADTPTLMPISMLFDYKDLILDYGNTAVDDTSRSGTVLVHKPTDWTFGFWHGPYVALPRGGYEVVYRVKSENACVGHLLTLDVTSDSGKNQLAKKYVYGHDVTSTVWSNITLRFDVDQPQASVEFRCTYASNLTTNSLDFIEVNQYSPTSNSTFGSTSFNHENLTFKRGKTATNGIISYDGNDSNAILFGLSAKVPPGTYTADFWFKIGSLSHGHVLSLKVDDFNGTNLAEAEIYASSFSQTETWHRFSLNFAIGNFTSIVEIRAFSSFINSTTLSFSYVELRKNE